jgi:hypothetical protein
VSTSPVIALRKAIRACLLADASLTTALGGAHIYDEAPRDAAAPYITFGDAQARDWSTASDRGSEQFPILNVWSEQRGVREALAIAEQTRALLDDAALTLDGHRLVNMRFVSIETKRENGGRLARASLRLRAVTEAL